LLKDIIIAIQAYFQAHRFIREQKLWRWIIVPGILYALLFGVSLVYFSQTSTTFIEWFILKTGLRSWVERLNNGSLSFLLAMGTLLVWLISLLFYFSLFKYLFLIVGSPIFSYLSEKTEAIMEGREIPFSFSQLLHDMKRGILLAIRNSFWQTIYVLTILILSFIPVVGWLTPFMALLIECYYYGFSMLDYSMERMNMSVPGSIAYISNHKGLAIGNGMVFYLLHLLPVIGWILAPSYAVVAATISIHPIKKTDQALTDTASSVL
jgi:CysZ protein